MELMLVVVVVVMKKHALTQDRQNHFYPWKRKIIIFFKWMAHIFLQVSDIFIVFCWKLDLNKLCCFLMLYTMYLIN